MRQNDTNSPENERAKDAYKALKTISLRRSDRDEYKNFEQRVKNRAEDEYKYSKTTGKEYEVSASRGKLVAFFLPKMSFNRSCLFIVRCNSPFAVYT